VYQNAAILALIALLYSVNAGAIERSWISGPIAFVGLGVLLGPLGFDLLHLQVTAEGLRVIAELTLAMVLFTDAANADLAVLRGSIGIPQRLLLIGLPLTILLGFAVAAVVLPQLDVLELALLAAMLAPTDAALGKPVVTNPAVPPSVREGLNIESGLNDGICVPVVIILLDLAVGTQVEGRSLAAMAGVVVEEIGIGLAIGLLLPLAAAALVWLATKRGWLSKHWLEVPIVALAAACFAAAQAAGGSGFIACFVGGLLTNALRRRGRHALLLRGAENCGEILALVTWIVFGAGVVGPMFDRMTWPVVLYAMLSLTVIRMLPVFVCLAGSGMSGGRKLFIGWFGPRGLASIVFGIMVLDAKLPGNDTLMAVIACTILLSVVAHGITANPLVRRIGTDAEAREGSR
jgi:NhaP-type Na+/H+ or K+/H+ antiporter